MKTKAAVVVEPGKPIEIEELDLDGPREGEVLIRYTHAGRCSGRAAARAGCPRGSWRPCRTGSAGRSRSTGSGRSSG